MRYDCDMGYGLCSIGGSGEYTALQYDGLVDQPERVLCFGDAGELLLSVWEKYGVYTYRF